MTTTSLEAEAGRRYWRGVLLAGGSTAIPRWTLDPVPGVAGYEATIPRDLVMALRLRAGLAAARGDLRSAAALLSRAG